MNKPEVQDGLNMETPLATAPEIKQVVKKKRVEVQETAPSAPVVFKENPTKEEIKKMSKEEVQALIRRMRDKDAELVTGVFQNFETPSSSDTMGAVRFVYAQYPGEQLNSYELWDGHRYSLPRGLVRRLKNECYVPIYERVTDPVMSQQGVLQAVADGRLRTPNTQMKVARKKHRFGFSIMDYMDYEMEQEMTPSKVLQVTY